MPFGTETHRNELSIRLEVRLDESPDPFGIAKGILQGEQIMIVVHGNRLFASYCVASFAFYSPPCIMSNEACGARGTLTNTNRG